MTIYKHANTTLCRPSKIDIEQVRFSLPKKYVNDIRYYEPVAVIDKGIVITGTILSIFKIGNLRRKPIVVKYKDIIDISHDIKPRQIFANRDPEEKNSTIIVSTLTKVYQFCPFDYKSHLLFYLQECWRSYLVRSQMECEHFHVPSDILEKLIMELQRDFLATADLFTRTEYLMELKDIAVTSLEAKKIFFRNDDFITVEGHTFRGWFAYLLHEIKTYEGHDIDPRTRVQQLRYVLEILRTVNALLFDGVSIEERLYVVENRSFEFTDLLDIFTIDFKDEMAVKEIQKKKDHEVEWKERRRKDSRAPRASIFEYRQVNKDMLLQMIQEAGNSNAMCAYDKQAKVVVKKIMDVQASLLLQAQGLLVQGIVLKSQAFPKDLGISSYLASPRSIQSFELWFERFLKRFVDILNEYGNSMNGEEICRDLYEHTPRLDDARLHATELRKDLLSSNGADTLQIWNYCRVLCFLLAGDFKIRNLLKEEHSDILKYYLKNERLLERISKRLDKKGQSAVVNKMIKHSIEDIRERIKLY